MLGSFKNVLNVRVFNYKCSKCKDTGYIKKRIKPTSITTNIYNIFNNTGVPIKAICDCEKGQEIKDKK